MIKKIFNLVILLALRNLIFSQVLFNPDIEYLQKRNGDTICLTNYKHYIDSINAGLCVIDKQRMNLLKQQARHETNNWDWFPLVDVTKSSNYFAKEDGQDINSQISKITNGAALFSELAVDYLGDFRVSVAGTFAQQDTLKLTLDEAERVIDFFNTGGTLLVRADMPVFLFTTIKPKSGSFLGSYLSLKAGGNLPNLGTAIESPEGYLDVGWEWQAKITSEGGNMSLVTILRPALLLSSPAYFVSLDTKNTIIGYMTSSIGLGFAGFTLLLNNPIGFFVSDSEFTKIPANLNLNVNLQNSK